MSASAAGARREPAQEEWMSSGVSPPRLAFGGAQQGGMSAQPGGAGEGKCGLAVMWLALRKAPSPLLCLRTVRSAVLGCSQKWAPPTPCSKLREIFWVAAVAWGPP